MSEPPHLQRMAQEVPNAAGEGVRAKKESCFIHPGGRQNAEPHSTSAARAAQF